MGVASNVLDNDIVVTMVEHLHYYVQFRTNTFWKGINTFINPTMG